MGQQAVLFQPDCSVGPERFPRSSTALVLYIFAFFFKGNLIGLEQQDHDSYVATVAST